MTEYQFEKTFCKICGKANFCIIWEMDPYCNDCFNWIAKIHATTKDEVRQIMYNCGIEDLEN